MPKQEVPIQTLSDFLPPNTAEPVIDYLQRYGVHLTITRARRSALGDYRHRYQHQPHRISVNGNLNPYAFLITLLHELAHLLTYERCGNRVLAHGKEWKHCFSDLLQIFLLNHSFPVPLENELKRTIRNPAASSCAEVGLIRILRQYDSPEKIENRVLMEELAPLAEFSTSDGRHFRVDKKMRKRFLCTEQKTGKQYLFSPVYEVIPLGRSGNGLAH
ncbi:MAG: SprT family zinc-dependent metalloprotease [Bacteroidetes bacterium]|nr:SprT family zinc-dependent metalloprotease [Bacteroidota bacterium]